MAAQRTTGAGCLIDLRQAVVPADGLIAAVAAGGMAGTAAGAMLRQQMGATVTITGQFLKAGGPVPAAS